MSIFKLTDLADQLCVITNCESTSLLNAKVGKQLVLVDKVSALKLISVEASLCARDALSDLVKLIEG